MRLFDKFCGRRAFLVLVPLTTLPILWRYYRQYNEKSKRDRISELPDDVLRLIIKDLNQWQIVQLSTLSRRWQRFCLTSAISKLCFDWSTMNGEENEYFPEDDDDGTEDLCSTDKDRFIKGVNKFIEFSKHTSELSCIEVNFCLGLDFAKEVDSWIHFAIDKGVESMTIHLACDRIDRCQGTYTLRAELFNGNNVLKLRHLSLKSCILGHGLFDRLRNLKTLTLKSVIITDQQQIKEIFDCCFNLEKLEMEQCDVPSKLCISSGHVLQLKVLSVKMCSQIQELEVVAPNLADLCYMGELVTFSFHEVPSLKKLCFAVLCLSQEPRFLDQHFRNLPSLEALSVSADTHWLYRLPLDVNTFSKLKELRVFTTTFTEFQIEEVQNILTTCPLLENLRISTKFCRRGRRDIAPPLPVVHHNKLKLIQLGPLHRIWEQFEVVEYLLTCAISLEKMIIVMGTTVGVSTKQHQALSGETITWFQEKGFERTAPEVGEQDKVIRLLQGVMKPGGPRLFIA